MRMDPIEGMNCPARQQPQTHLQEKGGMVTFNREKWATSGGPEDSEEFLGH